MLELSGNELLTEIVRRMDPRFKLLRTWPLLGGVSAQVAAFEIAFPDGRTQKFVLRQHGETDLRQNPRVAAHEFNLLLQLHHAEIAAPIPFFLDQKRDVLPTPYIVVTYMEGETDFAPADVDGAVQQMAEYLAKLHSMDSAHTDLSFLPDKAQSVASWLGDRPPQVNDSLCEGRIRDTLEAVWPLPSHNRPVLLHGDFWPGNVLWKEGELVAVIDWEDAAVGDPLADLGNARLEILWTLGNNAMQQFTQHYLFLTQIDAANLPYWDLYAALRPIGSMVNWGLDEDVLQAMREAHRQFTTQAFDAVTE